MKVLLFAIALLIAGINFLGCSKKNSPDTTTVTTTPYVNGSIAGAAFAAAGDTVAYATKSSSGGMNFTYLYARAIDGRAIKITLINLTGLATIYVASGNVTGDYYPSGFSGSYSRSVSGTISFTALSPKMIGNFNFHCADNTDMNASFSINAL